MVFSEGEGMAIVHRSNGSNGAHGVGHCSMTFAAAEIDSFAGVLDALVWLDAPEVKQIAQFAGVAVRTAEKLLKNCEATGLVEAGEDGVYRPGLPYPYKGNCGQRRAVIREALVRMPLMKHLRNLLSQGDSQADALRKAATMVQVVNYNADAFEPLMKWARQLKVLQPRLMPEDLIQEGLAAKAQRQKLVKAPRVAVLCHCSADKGFARDLAEDLTRAGVRVWLDEQTIGRDGAGQAVAESDCVVVLLSDEAMKSGWPEQFDGAISEIEKHMNVKVLSAEVSACNSPPGLAANLCADFAKDYQSQLGALLGKL